MTPVLFMCLLSKYIYIAQPTTHYFTTCFNIKKVAKVDPKFTINSIGGCSDDCVTVRSPLSLASADLLPFSVKSGGDLRFCCGVKISEVPVWENCSF